MAWRLPDGFVATAAPGGDGFRLGELLVLPHGEAAPVRRRVAGEVLACGYRPLPEADGWLHFRPRSCWRDGIGRHARLRDQNLHVRILETEPGRWAVQLVGLLTAALERRLADLAAVYERA